MGSRSRVRVGREVSYNDATYGGLPARITGVNSDGTVTLTVFTPANANGVTRALNVPQGSTSGTYSLFGDGIGSESV